MLPPDPLNFEGGLTSSTAMSATVTKVAFTFKSQWTADAESVFVKVGSVSSAQPLTVGIQAVDTATKKPNGVWLGATNNAKGSIATPVTSTAYEVTLGEVAPLVRGTLYAVVVEWISTTGSLNVITHQGVVIPARTSESYSRVIYTSGSWGANAGILSPLFAVKFNGIGNYNSNCVVPTTVNLTNSSSLFASNSTPNERGNKLILPACTISGIWAIQDIDANFDVVLYDATGTELESILVTTANEIVDTYDFHEFPINDRVLEAGTYRVTIRPSTTTSCNRWQVTFTAAQTSLRSMGTDCCLTTRTNGGAWTDDPLSQMAIGVVVKEFAAGSGGFYNPFRNPVFGG